MNFQTDRRQSFERRRQRPLVLEVRDELERIILNGEVPAGERLNEYSLAEQMGVSRGPVREAARSLERDGLVTTVSNQGVFVRKFLIDEALELFDMRAMVAGYICARVAETAEQDTKADLWSIVERMDDLTSSGDEESYFAANFEFHDRIANASGARRAKTLYIALGKEICLLRRQIPLGQAHLIGSNAEHKRIVAAIESGDSEAARREGTEHHLNGKKRLLEALSGRKAGTEYPARSAVSHQEGSEPHR